MMAAIGEKLQVTLRERRHDDTLQHGDWTLDLDSRVRMHLDDADIARRVIAIADGAPVTVGSQILTVSASNPLVQSQGNGGGARLATGP